MKKTLLVWLLLGGWSGLGLAQTARPVWSVSPDSAFSLHYTSTDAQIATELLPILRRSVRQVEAFFGHPFPHSFEVYIFPDRPALDHQWQQDWGDSTFQSACWMVASGTGRRLDVLSPQVWNTSACEHVATDRAALQQLLTHELVHVYHGQHNPTTDFTGMDDLAWWVEGLATFASGQLDSARISRLQTSLRTAQAPNDLQKFWSGQQRYGLAGSAVAWVDASYGRAVLFELLPLIHQKAIFERLRTTEDDFLQHWRLYWEKK